MESKSHNEISEMRKELKHHDGNLYSESSVDESKLDNDDVGDLTEHGSTSVMSVVKIKETFLNSNVDIYLLANPNSGSREAKTYTNLQSENYRFTLDGNEVFMRICNITKRDKVGLWKDYIKASIDTKINRDATEDDKPIKLKQLQVIVVIWGGDGTFMNIVQEFKEDGIDVDKLSFAIFPFGTANDISAAFNWGRKPPKQMLTNLFRVCHELLEAVEHQFNVWEVNIEVATSGGDVFVPHGKSLKSLWTKKLTKIMCHSFSFGVDARVGFNFEQKRTKSRVWNQAVYGFEGCKRLMDCWCSTKTLKVGNLLHSFSKKDESKSAGSEGSEDLEAKINEQTDPNQDVLIASDSSIKAKYLLKDNPVSFYCTNIEKIMGGRNNLWGNSKGRLGIQNSDGSKVNINVFPTSKGAYNDGKLEFATYSTLLHLLAGKGQRIAQDDGPFEIKFKQGDHKETYVNIDGEFYKVVRPVSITIQKADKLWKDASLRVLVNEKKDAFKR